MRDYGWLHVALLLCRFARANRRTQISLDLLETPWPSKRGAEWWSTSAKYATRRGSRIRSPERLCARPAHL